MVSPFPWQALDHVSRGEIRALAAARAWATERVDAARFIAALGDILQAKVEVLVRGARGGTVERGGPARVGILLAPAAGPAGDGLVVEVESALASAIVGRATRRGAPAIPSGREAPPEIAGALGAVLAAAIRRAHAGHAVLVVYAGPSDRAAALLSDRAGEIVALHLTVILDADAFGASIRIPSALFSDRVAPRDPGALARMGSTPISLPVVVASVAVPREDLAALAAGDVLVVPGMDPARATLAAPRSERGVRVRVAPDRAVMIEGVMEALPWSAPAPKETRMDSSTQRDAVTDAVLDAPVVVRVEVGVCELPARDWAALGRGDVLSLQRRIGEPCVLRVAGVEVALGELVQVDGELGVRILERTA